MDAVGTGTTASRVCASCASRCASPPSGPTSARCCPCTSPTATRASRPRRSWSAATRRSRRYVARNVAAVREVAARARPDVALANHLVMGPAIVARALGGAASLRGEDPRQRARVHRQARPRALPAATPARALAGARGVLVGSRHTAESLWAAWTTPRCPPARAWARPASTWTSSAAAARGGGRRRRARSPRACGAAAPGRPGAAPRSAATGRPPAARWPPGPRRATATSRSSASSSSPRASTCSGRVAARPAAGARRAPGRRRLRRLPRGASSACWRALAGRRPRAWPASSPTPAARPRAARARRCATCCLPRRLDAAPDGAYLAAAARGCPSASSLTGRLEHDELAPLLAACEAQVVPSTFPEAFGMVAAEAAACGALPVSAAHSGLAEVTAPLAGRGAGRGARLAGVRGR